MPQVSRTEIFDIEVEKFYNLILDYELYPEFVDGITRVSVLKKTAKSAEVEFEIDMIKTFRYTLKLSHSANKKVSWTLVEGDLFKKSDGFWELESLGKKKTKVTYSIDVDFKLLVPKMISQKLVDKSLPSMMQSYYKKAKSL